MTDAGVQSFRGGQSPHVIVFGNVKGGTGKSTLAIHVLIACLHEGYNVGSIDVDAHQGTLTRYLANRKRTYEENPNSLLMPCHHPIMPSTASVREEAEADETQRFEAALADMAHKDCIIIDTAGSDTHLSRRVLSYAHTLITPFNDSLMDLDVLVRAQGADFSRFQPSLYAEIVWEQKKLRALHQGKTMDWVVLRNRLSNLFTRNKAEVEQALEILSRRLGFRFVPGFKERVIFRELFAKGLTLLDLDQDQLAVSHVAARQELRRLMGLLNLPAVNNPPSPTRAA